MKYYGLICQIVGSKDDKSSCLIKDKLSMRMVKGIVIGRLLYFTIVAMID